MTVSTTPPAPAASGPGIGTPLSVVGELPPGASGLCVELFAALLQELTGTGQPEPEAGPGAAPEQAEEPPGGKQKKDGSADAAGLAGVVFVAPAPAAPPVPAAPLTLLFGIAPVHSAESEGIVSPAAAPETPAAPEPKESGADAAFAIPLPAAPPVAAAPSVAAAPGGIPGPEAPGTRTAPLAAPAPPLQQTNPPEMKDSPPPVATPLPPGDPAAAAPPLAFAARLEEVTPPETPASRPAAQPAEKPPSPAGGAPESIAPEPVERPRIVPAASGTKDPDLPNRQAPHAPPPGKTEEPKPAARAASPQMEAPSLPIHRAEPQTVAPARDAPPQPASQPALARLREVPEPAAPRPAPSAGLSLSLGEPGGERVEIRVQEKQGAVQVAVRSSDPALNSSLRGELSSLVTRLESRGYTAETWAPAETGSAPARASGGNFSEPRQQAGQGNSGGGGGQSGDPGPGGDQRGRQEQRPRWLEEWERSAEAGKRINR